MTEKPDLAQLTQTLAVEMTAITGTIWRADIDPDRWANHIFTETAYISLSIDGYSAPYRLKAWASTPRGIASLIDHETISMSIDRQPAALAADIKRRLLPHAQSYLIECKQHQDRIDQQTRKENEIRKALSKYLKYIEFNKSFYSANNKIHNVEIRTSEIEMRLTVTPAEAIKVCKLLKG